jgi:hypothetical protein
MVKLFPTIMLILSILSSCVYFINHDIKNGVYWAAASVLTWSVTYL